MPHGKRPPSSSPTHTLLDTLDELRIRLNHTGTNPGSMSVIEAYSGFIKSSEHGRSCQYAQKSLSLFFLQDYNEVKDLILKLATQIRELEDANNKKG